MHPTWKQAEKNKAIIQQFVDDGTVKIEYKGKKKTTLKQATCQRKKPCNTKNISLHNLIKHLVTHLLKHDPQHELVQAVLPGIQCQCHEFSTTRNGLISHVQTNTNTN